MNTTNMIKWIKNILSKEKKKTKKHSFEQREDGEWVCKGYNVFIKMDGQAIKIPYGGVYSAYVKQLKKIVEARNDS